MLILHQSDSGETLVTAPAPGLDPIAVATRDLPPGTPFIISDADALLTPPDFAHPTGIALGSAALEALADGLSRAAEGAAAARAALDRDAAEAAEADAASARAVAERAAEEALFARFKVRLAAEQAAAKLAEEQA